VAENADQIEYELMIMVGPMRASESNTRQTSATDGGWKPRPSSFAAYSADCTVRLVRSQGRYSFGVVESRAHGVRLSEGNLGNAMT
jgi:hypothetical protein